MTTATYVTNKGLFLMSTVDFDAIDFRALMIKNEVAAATGRDHDTVTQAIAAGTEADCTGYSRKTLAGVSATEDDTNDRSDIDFSDISWGALGGAANCQLSQVVIYREGGGTDATRDVIAYIGSTTFPFTTNGSAVTTAIAVLFRLTSTAT